MIMRVSRIWACVCTWVRCVVKEIMFTKALCEIMSFTEDFNQSVPFLAWYNGIALVVTQSRSLLLPKSEHQQCQADWMDANFATFFGKIHQLTEQSTIAT